MRQAFLSLGLFSEFDLYSIVCDRLLVNCADRFGAIQNRYMLARLQQRKLARVFTCLKIKKRSVTASNLLAEFVAYDFNARSASISSFLPSVIHRRTREPKPGERQQTRAGGGASTQLFACHLLLGRKLNSHASSDTLRL